MLLEHEKSCSYGISVATASLTGTFSRQFVVKYLLASTCLQRAAHQRSVIRGHLWENNSEIVRGKKYWSDTVNGNAPQRLSTGAAYGGNKWERKVNSHWTMMPRRGTSCIMDESELNCTAVNSIFSSIILYWVFSMSEWACPDDIRACISEWRAKATSHYSLHELLCTQTVFYSWRAMTKVIGVRIRFDPIFQFSQILCL